MISVNDMHVQFGGRELFSGVSFVVNPRERMGLVGRNGSGKTTLMRILAGQVEPTAGQVQKPSGTTLGYLPQHMRFADDKSLIAETRTAFDELNRLKTLSDELGRELSERDDYESPAYLKLADRLAETTEKWEMLGGGTAAGQAEQVLKGLGFMESDFGRPCSEFSGGWRMRVEIAKLLLRNPDLLLLDEPTNHLDLESIQWLEDFLQDYPGGVIIVSHDKRFLNRLTKRTVEISLGKIYDYNAPYTQYLSLRAERREQQLAAQRNQDKKIEQTERFIERFRAKNTKATQVQSRVKQLERMERIEVEEEDTADIHFRFPPAPHSGKTTLEIKGLSKSYGELEVLHHVDMNLAKGEKVAFVGKNGQGKTTLARVITGELEYTGDMKLGHMVSIGYYAQNQADLLDAGKTVFETLDHIARGDARKNVRNILGSFLFSGDDIDKKVKVLSGGERSRLALAALLLEPVNLLVLDEPTNHLDIRSKDILKRALKQYDGSLILVSHDRDFLHGLTDAIYEFKDKNIRQSFDDIDQFLKKKKLDGLDQLNEKKANKTDASTPKSNKKRYEEDKKRKRGREKIARRITSSEKEIERLEAEIGGLNELFASNAEAVKDAEKFNRWEALKKKLDDEMERWEKLNAELEAFDQS